jgi:hypothetical protein
MYSQTVTKLYGCLPEMLKYGIPLEETRLHARKMFSRESPLFPTATGIEVEIEDVRNPTVDPGLWRFTNDSSLRNGIELISHPLENGEILSALSALDIFYKRNSGAVFSHRCSIHIHLNVSQITYEQLIVMLGFYLTVENLFFAAFFPHRKGNNYCYPLANTQMTQNDISRRRLSRETWKYAAVNCYHLMDFGTLEFRQHPGTKDVFQLLTWIKTLQNIFTYAQETKLDDFKEVLWGLNTSSGYTEYVRRALPDWTVPVEPDHMYDAVTAAKYFISKGVE